MWDAVVKALTPQQAPQQGQPSATPASALQKAPAKPVATLEDIRATLLSQGENDLVKWLAEKNSRADLLEVAETIETTPWAGGTKAATMANIAVLLREMAKVNPLVAPKRDWMDSGGSGSEKPAPTPTPIPGDGRIDKSRGC
jgi:hypothetical protein